MMKKGLICVVAVLLLALVFTVSCKEAVYYTVRFNSNGGTVYKVQQVVEGNRVSKVKNPVKDGFTFEGWFSDPNFVFLYDFNQPVYSDLTLYAKWGGSFDPEDYMMLSGQTWFGAFKDITTDKGSITKIKFEKTYASGSSEYVDLTMKQNGNVKGYLEKDNQNATKYIIHIVGDYVYGNTDCSYMFSDGQYSKRFSKLTSLVVSNFNTTVVTNVEHMFSGCSSLTSLDLSSWNRNTAGDTSTTSNIKEMWNMFAGCDDLASVNFRGFDTSSVESMDDMFYSCSKLTSLDLSSFDVTSTSKRESVPSTSYMFDFCGPVGEQLTVKVNVSSPNTEERWDSVLSGFAKGTTVSGKTSYTRTRQ